MTITMPTPIETFEDILAAMENNPRLQAAMRQHILDQEFLQLPAIVRELQQAVAQLTQLVRDYIAATDARLDRIEGRLDRIEGRLDQVDGRLDQVDGRLDQVDGRLDRLEGNVNRLIGTDYERKAARRASRLANRYLGMADMPVIYAVTMPDNNQFPEILDNAIRAGRMDENEAEELEEVDIVMRGPGGYVMAEVSVTLDETDVQRARERAGLLSKAVTEPVRAIVIGARALDVAYQLAADNHVAVMILPE